jgi:hypothetical protein
MSLHAPPEAARATREVVPAVGDTGRDDLLRGVGDEPPAQDSFEREKAREEALLPVPKQLPPEVSRRLAVPFLEETVALADDLFVFAYERPPPWSAMKSLEHLRCEDAISR